MQQVHTAVATCDSGRLTKKAAAHPDEKVAVWEVEGGVTLRQTLFHSSAR